LLLTTHSLLADDFTELAAGVGDRSVVGQLRDAQLSKHLMLLHVVDKAVSDVNPPSRATAAFRAGYQLLEKAQAADPVAVASLLSLPHVGSWAHNCLACLDAKSPVDFGYLAAVAAAAAARLGIPFELDVPVRDGRVQLPGLGCLEVAGEGEWAGLSSDGERLRAGGHVGLACAALVPDDGSGDTVPGWHGTPLIRAEADGQVWEVLLETTDRYLDRYALPMLVDMPADDITTFRQLVKSAWELLVRHHAWAAGPVADGVPVVVPLVPRSDLDSATSPAAFGAIAMSVPPSAVSMAETLVHEFQHLKLCGLLDMVDLVEPSADRGYAPWRDDPRPAGGILQGVYAFTGVVRFWNAQRLLEGEPGDVLRAHVLYERWRLAVEQVSGTLLEGPSLTPIGVRFVTELRDRGQREVAPPLPVEAAEIAREVALDNWLTWQLSHTAVDAGGVARLAAAYQRDEPFSGQALPATRIKEGIREIDSVARSRVINMRYQEPQRYRQLSGADVSVLGPADGLLIRGDAAAAVAAYRERLTAEADPAAWVGLALAVRRLPAASAWPALDDQLPLIFETHACLVGQGLRVDPLDLAGWFE
jgi:HEXXH motif-containing protein